jgi:hypothetical protein
MANISSNHDFQNFATLSHLNLIVLNPKPLIMSLYLQVSNPIKGWRATFKLSSTSLFPFKYAERPIYSEMRAKWGRKLMLHCFGESNACGIKI